MACERLQSAVAQLETGELEGEERENMLRWSQLAEKFSRKVHSLQHVMEELGNLEGEDEDDLTSDAESTGSLDSHSQDKEMETGSMSPWFPLEVSPPSSKARGTISSPSSRRPGRVHQGHSFVDLTDHDANGARHRRPSLSTSDHPGGGGKVLRKRSRNKKKQGRLPDRGALQSQRRRLSATDSLRSSPPLSSWDGEEEDESAKFSTRSRRNRDSRALGDRVAHLPRYSSLHGYENSASEDEARFSDDDVDDVVMDMDMGMGMDVDMGMDMDMHLEPGQDGRPELQEREISSAQQGAAGPAPFSIRAQIQDLVLVVPIPEVAASSSDSGCRVFDLQEMLVQRYRAMRGVVPKIQALALPDGAILYPTDKVRDLVASGTLLTAQISGFTDSPLVEVYKAVCVQRGVVPGNAVCLQLDHQVMAELLLPQAGMSACAVEALCEAISQQQLPLLRKWVLTGNSCSEMSLDPMLEALSSLHALEHLDLSCNGLTVRSLLPLLKVLSENVSLPLRELSLSFNDFRTENLDVADIRTLPKTLRSFSVRSCFLTYAVMSPLLSILPASLHSLDVSGNPLSDPCVRSGVQQQPLLQALGTREPGMTVQLRVLHALDLDPPLHIEGFDTLFPSQPSPEMLPFLTELHLGGSQIGDACLEQRVLPWLCRGSIQLLDLGCCEISTSGCCTLAQSLESNKTLTSLSLRGNIAIGHAGARALIRSLDRRCNQTLTSLDLLGCQLGAGAIFVLQDLPQSSLQQLDCSWNRIPIRALLSEVQALLSQVPQLLSLDLSGNESLMEEEVDRLQELWCASHRHAVVRTPQRGRQYQLLFQASGDTREK